ncbi:MAG: S8 family serine peptidase [Micromonosporaceae bacterium]
MTGVVLTLVLAVGAPALGSPDDGAAASAADLTAIPLEPTDRVQADKAPTSRLAKSDPALLKRTDSRPARVMIKLDYDAMASYQGGVANLRATSPSATGRPLTGRSAAERDYQAYVASKEQAFVAALRKVVPGAEVQRRLRVVYGGVATTIPASAAKTVARLPGVVAVQSNQLAKPLTDSSPAFVNAPPVYAELGTTANAGEGVIYGNLDTGIWPEHPSFGDLGNLDPPPGPARECNYGDNPLTPAADPFVCQNKLIGGAHFTDFYDDDCAGAGQCLPDPYAGTARDGDGHGTHTSSTSAGNIVEDVSALDRPLPSIHGLAPGAWVMEYKVCGPDGCFNSDSAAAVGQAILDGVDVINFSISGGEDPFNDPVELAFLDAYAANVLVSASAGNSGPGAGTSNHLGPWTTTVAASTQTREFATTLSLHADNGDTFTVDGASITAGVDTATPVVLARDFPGYSDALCASEPSSPDLFDGFIIACQRGAVARVWKGFVVFSGGGEGMILYNPALQDTETDNHWLPTVHLADGTNFVAYMDSHTGVTGSFPQGEARNGQGDVMAAFSSRGPGGPAIKPDLTAPGVQILAGASPTPPNPDPVGGGSPPGNYFQAIAGTSMSSPHVAGAAILVRAVHPGWTPGQIKSALMTTAITDVVKEDLVTPADPFDFGAGRIDIGDSVEVAITIDETAENFFALGSDPVNAVHLNIPSINAPVMPGRLVTTRVVKNTTGQTQRLTSSAQAPPGSTITVTPRRISVPPGRSATFRITIESDAPIGEQQFGQVRFSSSGGALHLPVAFIHTQGSVNLTQACSPLTVPLRGTSECTVEAVNNSFEDQVVDLDTFTTDNLRIVGTDGATLVDPRHAQLHDVTLSGFQPGVPAVGPGELFGYFPLDPFTDPIPIGDEEIINFTMSPFEYAGQTWSRIGVDSNGYLIVGGGTAEDNNCCNLPAGPDPARPNNVLAPFWTDLDGTGAPGIFATGLTDGVNTWVVFEWRVNVFGTTSSRVFQVWIGVDGVEDITYAYDPDNMPADPGFDFLVGAENSRGLGDMEPVLPTGDLRVSSTPATPGGRVTYGLTVRGVKAGVGTVTTEMRATRVPGVTVVKTNIQVLT